VPIRRGYAVNLGIRAPAVPEAMGKTVFLRDADGSGEHLIRVEQTAREDGKVSLNASCLVETVDEHRIASGSLRDAILDRLRAVMPYLDSHLEVLHSPFDAFGPVDLTGARSGRPDAPPPFHPDDVPVWRLVPPSFRGELGMENLTHRTGIKGLLLCGDQVVSGLGAEGEFIAAWGAAEIAGRMDPSRQKVVRAMRSKADA